MKKWVLTFGLLIVCFVIHANAQESVKGPVPKRTDGKPREDSRSPFRYVIVSGVSETEKYANKGPYYYMMDVLMEDKAFNESNLKLLFSMLSKRFTDRPSLFVDVYTSLDAIRTPEEYDETGLFGPVDDYYKYKYASFSRNGNGESFEYGIPNLVKPTIVIMKPPPAVWPPKDSSKH